jgi:hypothetical protein
MMLNYLSFIINLKIFLNLILIIIVLIISRHALSFCIIIFCLRLKPTHLSWLLNWHFWIVFGCGFLFQSILISRCFSSTLSWSVNMIFHFIIECNILVQKIVFEIDLVQDIVLRIWRVVIAHKILVYFWNLWDRWLLFSCSLHLISMLSIWIPRVSLPGLLIGIHFLVVWHRLWGFVHIWKLMWSLKSWKLFGVLVSRFSI